MTRYFDASALAKRYVYETGSQQMEPLILESYSPTSQFTQVEVASALARRAGEGTLTIRERDRALEALEQDMAIFYIVGLNSEVTAQAVKWLARHRLRGPDSIQLASTMYLQKHLQDTLEIVVFDPQFITVACLEGLTIWNAKQQR